MKKKEVKNKKMTIDSLAVIMKAGFDGVNKKFSGVNKKIDNSVDLIDKLATSTLNHFERLEEKMATKEDFKRQQDISQIMLKEIIAIHEDTKFYRENVSALYADGLSYDKRINNLTVRVEKLELKSK